MRIVLDADVLVSALLSPQNHPAQVLDLATRGEAALLFDDRILYEYRKVLRRKKFGFDSDLIDEFVAFLDRIGEFVQGAPTTLRIPDPDDLPFLEVALSGKADVLVTGNQKDYGKPQTKELKILSPHEFLKYYVDRTA